MVECLNKLLKKIYGDGNQSGCPRCPLFGIIVAIVITVIGYVLSEVSSEGLLTQFYNYIGIAISAVGVILIVLFLFIIYLGESRYIRLPTNSVKNVESSYNTSVTSSWTNTDEEGIEKSNDPDISKAPNISTTKNQKSSSSSDFSIIAETDKGITYSTETLLCTAQLSTA